MQHRCEIPTLIKGGHHEADPCQKIGCVKKVPDRGGRGLVDYLVYKCLPPNPSQNTTHLCLGHGHALFAFRFRHARRPRWTTREIGVKQSGRENVF